MFLSLSFSLDYVFPSTLPFQIGEQIFFLRRWHGLCRRRRRRHAESIEGNWKAARSDSVVAFAASQEFEVADYTSFEEALEEEAYHRTCFAFAFEEAVAVVVVAVVACILLLASYAAVGGIAVAARLLP